MTRPALRSSLPLLGILVAACAAAPEGPVAAAGPSTEAPMEAAALRAALEALGPLVDSLDSGDDPAIREEIEARVRRMTHALEGPGWRDRPLAAGRLRARVIFVALGEPPARRAALEESRALLDALLLGSAPR